MANISRNFSSSEFACPCCGKMTVVQGLIDALEDLRSACNDSPLVILSGYRCAAHNKAVRGASASQHCQGRAADVRVPSPMSLASFYAAAQRVEALKDGGIGLYPKEGFMHVDVRSTGRARWSRINGVYMDISAALKPVKEREG